jgi:hypothetical protein
MNRHSLKGMAMVEEWDRAEGWGIGVREKVWAAWGIEGPEAEAVRENIVIGDGAGFRVEQVKP